MQLTQDQIISFQKLYKEESGIELSEIEAQEKAQALIRYLGLKESQISTELAD